MFSNFKHLLTRNKLNSELPRGTPARHRLENNFDFEASLQNLDLDYRVNLYKVVIKDQDAMKSDYYK